MALTESLKVEIGSRLKEFALKDANGKEFKSSELFGKNGLLIYVVCNHCPYVNSIWDKLIEVAEFAKKVDVGVVAINPNINPSYPEDSAVNMLDKAKKLNLQFPYLVDESQSVVKEIGAVCTPDLFLFDKNSQLYYHGCVELKGEESLRDAL